MADQQSCPATHTIDTGDFAEPEQCELPIEHNVDGTWHQASWQTDEVEMALKWAPEIGEHCFWPRSPLSLPHFRVYLNTMLRHMLEANALFTNVPAAEMPAVGTVVQWRKWGEIPPPSGTPATDPPP